MSMKSFHRAFSAHPASVNETYTEHMAVAASFSWRLMYGGLACLIHAIFPFLFVTTGSRLVTELHDEMVTNRVRREARGGVLDGAD